MGRYVLAITGSSGPVLGIRVLRELMKAHEVHLVISSQALTILRDESGLDLTGGTNDDIAQRLVEHTGGGELRLWGPDEMEAPVASGSFGVDGTLVVPCSMKTLAGIAAGYADNLIARAADVAIKERRPLLVSPREMPFSAIHLENMLKLSRLGVIVAPPVPALYHQPATIDEMYDFLTGKILDAIGVEHELFRRWGE